MRFASYRIGERRGLALLSAAGSWRGLHEGSAGFPGRLQVLIEIGGDALKSAARVLADAPVVDLNAVTLMPPLSNPEKIVCIGLNYADHTAESGYKQPEYPTIFGRFNSSLIPHAAPIIRPPVSEQLDYEGELVAVMGDTARDVPVEKALNYVAGYSIFNDASLRDYQFKSPQWTAGKNFDDTGAFGPHFVTADELPPGCTGLRLQTRLNGAIVQDASTSNMVFPVAQLVSILSGFMTLRAGDLIVTGTPAGVGMGRKPQLWMKHGDVVEVEIEKIGVLRNTVQDRKAPAAAA